MLVRRYSVISIFKDMWREKKMVIIIAIICTLLGGLLGFITYQKESKEQISLEEKMNSEPVEGEETYITELRNYEESMAACEEAYALAVEQRDTLQKYMDNSILMKIDPENVQVAYAAYVVQDNANSGNVLNSIKSYINDGGLKEDALAIGGEELEVEGWKEIICVEITGNSLFITISHYNVDKVREIMRVVKECVESQNASISKTQGTYNLVLSNESYYSKIDGNIANSQNGNNNSLKTFENSVADQLIKINNFTDIINDYKEKYDINDCHSLKRGLTITIIVYCITGLIAGIVFSSIMMIVRVSASNKILNAQHLQYAGLTVYNIYDYGKKVFVDSIDTTVSEIEKIIKNTNGNNVCLWSLSDIDSNKEVVQKLKDKINLEVKYNIELCDCTDVLVVLTEKKDTYSALEDLIGKCSRLNINLLGIVVSE